MAKGQHRPTRTDDASTPTDTRSVTRQIGVRVPIAMSDRLEAIARREANGVSAVCRRLLATALASDDDEAV